MLRKGCKVCGRRGKLFLCSGCDCVRYCSASCQTKDWSAHQTDCAIMRASPSAKEEKKLYRAVAALDGARALRDVEATGKLLRAALAADVRECESNPVDEDGYEHAASIYYYGPAGYHPAG